MSPQKKIEERPLKAMARLQSNKATSQHAKLPYLGLEQLESATGRIIEYQEEGQPGEGNVFRRGDVLFGRLRPYLSKAAVATQDGKCTGELLVFRPNAGVHERFLLYSLLSLDFIGFADGCSQGTRMPRASYDFLGPFRRWFPAYDVQVGIASYLDRETQTIDGLVAAKQRQLAVLEELRHVRLVEAVCRGTRSAPTRSSGVGWMGKVPTHWTVQKMSHLARVESGHTPSRSEPAYWKNCNIPWLTTSDLYAFREGRKEYVGDTEHKLSTLGLANSSARLLPKGTVFLSRTASVGFSGVLGIPAATSQDFACWICDSKLVPEYLMFVLRAMRSEFERLAMGSTHQTIYTSDSAAFKTPLPPVDEQHEIVAAIRNNNEAIFAAMDAIRKSIDLLRERRQALITATVTGEMAIPIEVEA